MVFYVTVIDYWGARVIYILWQPSSGDKDYLFFLMGEVAAVFVDAALGVQDCLLKEIHLIH